MRESEGMGESELTARGLILSPFPTRTARLTTYSLGQAVSLDSASEALSGICPIRNSLTGSNIV